MVAYRLFTIFVLLALPPLAQTQPFASVVIKPSATSAPGASRLQVLPDGSLIGHSIPVIELMSLAYAIPENPSPRVSALPEWAVSQRFDLEAKTSTPLHLDREDTQTQKRTIEVLLQKLLHEHFGLVIKVKTVTTPVYALTLAGNDHKLAQSTLSPTDCILDLGTDGCHSFAIGFGHPLNAKGVDMFDLARYLENWTDLPVMNKTAIPGLFAMHSQGWRPMNLPPPPPGASANGKEFARLVTLSAVLSDFGLQLHREEASVPFYVVARLEQPR